MNELKEFLTDMRNATWGSSLNWTPRARAIDIALCLWYILLLKNGYVDYVVFIMAFSILIHAVRILMHTFKTTTPPAANEENR